MTSAAIRLGMVRLTDAAPVVYAFASGGFAEAGLDVTLSVEPSWANIADKLAWGLLDGAVMLPPLAIAMTLGLREPPTELLIPCGISRQGNAITLANRIAEPLLQDGRLPPAAMAARLRPLLPLRLAVVHTFSCHDLLLQRFLVNGGVDPATLAPFAVIPPAEMPEALAAGRIDGFCAGAPWGAVAAEAGIGRTVAVSADIMPDHPEKCLAVRAAFARERPDALSALRRVLVRAAAHCDDPTHTPAIADLLAAPEWVGVSASLIAASLPGGAGGEVDRSRFSAAIPRSDAAWFVNELGQRRALPADTLHRVDAMYLSM